MRPLTFQLKLQKFTEIKDIESLIAAQKFKFNKTMLVNTNRGILSMCQQTKAESIKLKTLGHMIDSTYFSESYSYFLRISYWFFAGHVIP